MTLKYLILSEADGGEFPHFCLAPVTHLELSLALQAYRPGRTIVSAGFVTIEAEGHVSTHGSSISLSLSPRSGDAALIRIFSQATRAA